MPCYHPLRAFRVGTLPSGKPKYEIHGNNVEYVRYKFNGLEVVNNIYREIPCGKCIGCRLDYSRQWANRLMLEAKYHTDNYFCTFTYDSDHILETRGSYVDPNTGELLFSNSLIKSHMQLFFKRLRKWYYNRYPEYKLIVDPDTHDVMPDCRDHDLRYFMCGEYGPETFRPHYHAMIFGLQIDDLKPYKKSFNGCQYYNSPTINKLWGKGFVVIGACSWESCAYTARYMLNKHLGKDRDYLTNFGLLPEYTACSRRPGLARWWYDDHKADILAGKKIVYDQGRTSWAPKYYDRLLDIDLPEEYDLYKDNKRVMALRANAAILSGYTCSAVEAREAQEINTLARTSVLRQRNGADDIETR